jgi:hypothetical protein
MIRWSTLKKVVNLHGIAWLEGDLIEFYITA